MGATAGGAWIGSGVDVGAVGAGVGIGVGSAGADELGRAQYGQNLRPSGMSLPQPTHFAMDFWAGAGD